jgi:hypothetical protein
MADYIPIKDEAFLDWADNLYNYALNHFTSWNIPSPQDQLGPLLTAYQTAFQTALNLNRDKVDVLAKNALKKEIRIYVRAYLINNPAVTDEDKTAMGLPVHKTTHTPVSVPTTAPQLFINTGTRRRFTITYQDEGSDRRGKPHGVHGVEVRWAILEHPPAVISELVNSAFDTKPPLTIDFEEHERGKKVFLCGRWEIQREGAKGLFGAIEERL